MKRRYGGRERTRPVLSRQIGYLLSVIRPVVEVGVVKTIGDLHFLIGVARVLICGRIYFRLTYGSRVPRFNAVRVHDRRRTRMIDELAVYLGAVLDGEYIVERFVRAVAESEVVLTCVEHIALSSVLVVGRDEIAVEFHGDVRFSACGNVYLCVIGELYRSFLHAVVFVVLRIGRLNVYLNGSLALFVVGVAHSHIDLKHVLTRVVYYAVYLLIVSRVGQAVAEGERYFFRVVVIACIALIEHHVLVTRFVVFVPDVNAFLVDDVVSAVCAVKWRTVKSKGKVSEILHRWRIHRHSGKSIHGMTGGVCVPFQHIDDAGEAIIARIAEPQAGIHVILIQPTKFHGHCAIKEHDYLIKLTGIVYRFEERSFLVTQRKQRLALVTSRTRQVGVLRAETSESHKRNVIILVERVLYTIPICGEIKFARLFRAVLFTRVLVNVIHLLIDGEPAVLERLLHIYDVLVVGSWTAGTTTVDDVCAVVAKERHFALVRLQRQRIVLVGKQY